jgi:hypothetical protein
MARKAETAKEFARQARANFSAKSLKPFKLEI